MTRTGTEEQLHALAGTAVWTLAAPAVIRPHRDGWLIFMRSQHAWYGTAEAAADALLSGCHGNRIPNALRSPRPTRKRPGFWLRAARKNRPKTSSPSPHPPKAAALPQGPATGDP